ncbi:unnamed protein product [Cladocopium goreaui]|uniref:DNA polymerase alpha-associated DNA helicase A n=1 Tax=Cladocopium goreaui TaxID=2562237 RepID=A0A9P1D2V5_9DINO|nr:unnamed protein product [Cladocopium goreaui]
MGSFRQIRSCAWRSHQENLALGHRLRVKVFFAHPDHQISELCAQLMPWCWDQWSRAQKNTSTVPSRCGGARKEGAVVKLLHNFFQKNETDHRLSVGIITPYLGQVRLIKELIYSDSATVHAKKLQKKVKLVKTVDGFQGNEQDIIVISTVRSNRKGQIGFVSDRRRLNVAITRARLRLWIIGDLTTLEHDDTLLGLDWFFRHWGGNFTYASDCSGMDTPLTALKMLFPANKSNLVTYMSSEDIFATNYRQLRRKALHA